MPDGVPVGVPQGYKALSGRFSYSIQTKNDLTFVWDGAAIGPDGDIVLIEEELTAPVHMHIQGHVARAGFMAAAGEDIRKLVWVVPDRHFHALWRIVEPWRNGLRLKLGIETPPCEYRNPSGYCLGVSRDYR